MKVKDSTRHSLKYRIHVRTKGGLYVETDYAPTEAEAREQASGWTGQRGQMTWKAVIIAPDGTEVATYKRGKEVKP